jgi:hypothetical protein
MCFVPGAVQERIKNKTCFRVGVYPIGLPPKKGHILYELNE